MLLMLLLSFPHSTYLEIARFVSSSLLSPPIIKLCIKAIYLLVLLFLVVVSFLLYVLIILLAIVSLFVMIIVFPLLVVTFLNFGGKYNFLPHFIQAIPKVFPSPPLRNKPLRLRQLC